MQPHSLFAAAISSALALSTATPARAEEWYILANSENDALGKCIKAAVYSFAATPEAAVRLFRSKGTFWAEDVWPDGNVVTVLTHDPDGSIGAITYIKENCEFFRQMNYLGLVQDRINEIARKNPAR